MMDLKTTSILIIGGYGHVGTLITAHLAQSKHYLITIAGRNKHKAESTADRLGNRIKGIQFDITSFGEAEKSILQKYEVVIVCIDQENTDFAAYCLSQSLLYLDITANTNFLLQLKKHDSFAVQHKALAVISLGLCPGLTNLFARELIERHPDVEEIVTGILLSLGEQYGKAAIEWTINNFTQDFKYNHTVVSSFKEGRYFNFAGMKGNQKAYRFNFSDQHALKESYPQKEFSTYLCLDNSFVTELLHILKKVGIAKLMKIRPIRNLVTTVFEKISLGSTGYAVSTLAVREDKVIDHFSVSGYEESAITAKITAICLEKLINIKNQYGVKDIQAILSLNDIWKGIKGEFLKI